MYVQQQIEDLITEGCRMLGSDFDTIAFQDWRVRAFECLNILFGRDHIYTKYFAHFVGHNDRANVLAASGVLIAAKQEMGGELELSKPLAHHRTDPNFMTPHAIEYEIGTIVTERGRLNR